MSVFGNVAFDHHQHVTFAEDRASGLRAIIAVHNSQLGPAVGGCRMFPYATEHKALFDVLRLSRGMTYKSALAGLPFGGGKSVIIGDSRKDKTPALLHMPWVISFTAWAACMWPLKTLAPGWLIFARCLPARPM